MKLSASLLGWDSFSFLSFCLLCGLVSVSPPATGIKQAIGVAISDSSMWVQCVIDYTGS